MYLSLAIYPSNYQIKWHLASVNRAENAWQGGIYVWERRGAIDVGELPDSSRMLLQVALRDVLQRLGEGEDLLARGE